MGSSSQDLADALLIIFQTNSSVKNPVKTNELHCIHPGFLPYRTNEQDFVVVVQVCWLKLKTSKKLRTFHLVFMKNHAHCSSDNEKDPKSAPAELNTFTWHIHLRMVQDLSAQNSVKINSSTDQVLHWLCCQPTSMRILYQLIYQNLLGVPKKAAVGRLLRDGVECIDGLF